MERKKLKSRAVFIVILSVLYIVGIMCGPLEAATTIVGSKHDFSEGNNTGNTPFARAFATDPLNIGFGLLIDEVCVFCHTPHGASTDAANGANTLLWNRVSSPSPGSGYAGYTMYSSASFTISPAAPTGISMMCMSCHDGVTSVAANMGAFPTLLNAPGTGNPSVIYTIDASKTGAIGDVYDGPTGFLGIWGANIGNALPGGGGTIDLSNDHPISFAYPATSSVLQEPTDPRLRLFGTTKKLECATCHTVHDNTNAPFLAMPNTSSLMCRNCHTL